MEFLTTTGAVALGYVLGTVSLALIVTAKDGISRRRYYKEQEGLQQEVLEEIASRYPDLFGEAEASVSLDGDTHAIEP